jgi:8-oxo-dGTP pyrophosphatase MutT (NUDIX family)
MAKEKSAGAVVFLIEEGKPLFLLLHYTSGHWEFVKGHIEAGEEELATVKREAEEETGIKDLKFIDGFKEGISYIYKNKNEVMFKEVNFYLAQTKTKKVVLSFEHIGYDWLDYEAALDRLTFKNAREILKKAYNKIKEKGIF